MDSAAASSSPHHDLIERHYTTSTEIASASSTPSSTLPSPRLSPAAEAEKPRESFAVSAPDAEHPAKDGVLLGSNRDTAVASSQVASAETDGLRRRLPHHEDSSHSPTSSLEGSPAFDAHTQLEHPTSTKMPDRAGYLPVSSGGYSPGCASSRGNFVRSLVTRRKLPCMLFVFVFCVIAPVYMLGPRMLGDERMKQYGLDGGWREGHYSSILYPLC